MQINLTEDETALLLDTLQDVTDRGPDGQGWKSNELSKLVASIEQQANALRLSGESWPDETLYSSPDELRALMNQRIKGV